MSSDEEILSLAMKFHEAYERLAPQYGYETRQETRKFDAQSPNGRLMIAVCREVMAEGAVPCGDFDAGGEDNAKGEAK